MLKLTSQEKEVLTLVGEYKTSKEIAQLMKLSPRTIQSYLDNIYFKLDVKGSGARHKAFAAAVENSMLD
jgi:DNA-binding CsgD family transcriptional regulator